MNLQPQTRLESESPAALGTESDRYKRDVASATATKSVVVPAAAKVLSRLKLIGAVAGY